MITNEQNVLNANIPNLKLKVRRSWLTKRMREQQIQSKRIKELEAEGYYVIKLITTNKNGIPDLIAIPKGSDVLLVEVKKPDGKL